MRVEIRKLFTAEYSFSVLFVQLSCCSFITKSYLLNRRENPQSHREDKEEEEEEEGRMEGKKERGKAATKPILILSHFCHN